MTRQTRSWLVAVVLLIGLTVTGGWTVYGQATETAQVIAVTSQPPAPGTPTAELTPTPTPSPTALPAPDPGPVTSPVPSTPVPSTPAPTKAPTTKAPTPPQPKPKPSPTVIKKPVVRPPVNSMHVSNSYLARYGARRATWDNVIDSGNRLPAVTSSCARSWRGAGKDAKLNWSSANYLCLSSLSGRGYKPQGVGGSATTEGYTIGNQPAADRNLVLTSWYSDANEPGLFAPNSGGSVTRLVVMDMDQRKYAKVELVRPGGKKGFRSIDSHGSGLVWAGQYLYSSSRGVLWMYNADDIVKVRGHYVLPAIARWTAHGQGGLSSISIDRSTSPSRLTAINYSKGGKAYMQTFELASNGLLAANGRSAAHDLTLRNSYGEKGRVVHSTKSLVVSGSSFQGVASVGPYGFANSSALHYGGRVVDGMVVLKNNRVIERFRMPHGNGESIYLDYKRGTFVSITEHGAQFLYQLPLQHVTDRAER